MNLVPQIWAATENAALPRDHASAKGHGFLGRYDNPLIRTMFPVTCFHPNSHIVIIAWMCSVRIRWTIPKAPFDFMHQIVHLDQNSRSQQVDSLRESGRDCFYCSLFLNCGRWSSRQSSSYNGVKLFYHGFPLLQFKSRPVEIYIDGLFSRPFKSQYHLGCIRTADFPLLLQYSEVFAALIQVPPSPDIY